MIVGYQYDTTIELPTYYLNTGQNAYDLEGDLRVSGINFELGVSGPMEFHLTSPFSYTDANGNVTKDIDDYTQYETGMITGLSNLNTIPAELTKTVRVPIQRKNNKYNLKIINDSISETFITKIISLGAIVNLVVFFIFLKYDYEERAKGVLLATFIIAILTIYINNF